MPRQQQYKTIKRVNYEGRRETNKKCKSQIHKSITKELTFFHSNKCIKSHSHTHTYTHISIWNEIYNLFALGCWTQHCRLTNRDIPKTAWQKSAIRSREKIGALLTWVRPNSEKFEFRAYVSFWYAINFYGTLGDNGGGSCKAEEVTMIGRCPSVSAFLGVDLACLLLLLILRQSSLGAN